MLNTNCRANIDSIKSNTQYLVATRSFTLDAIFRQLNLHNRTDVTIKRSLATARGNVMFSYAMFCSSVDKIYFHVDT